MTPPSQQTCHYCTAPQTDTLTVKGQGPPKKTNGLKVAREVGAEDTPTVMGDTMLF